MAFKYKYEKVLSLKIEEEDDKKHKLAAKIADMGRIKQRLEQVQIERRSFEDRYREELRRGSKAGEAWLIASNKRWYKEELEKLLNLLRLAENNVNLARMELTLASKEVKKFEKLKEKAYGEFKAREQREFNELIDGVMNFQVAKKNSL